MEKERIKDLIQKAKAAATDNVGMQLVESFEEFIDLYHDQENYAGDAEFARRLEESHNKFWASFNKAARSYGITREFLEEHLRRNPVPQQLMQPIVAQETIPSEKKLRKNGKKVRI